MAAARVVGEPGRWALHANRPNPFAAATTIEYELAAAGEARVEIYDVAGRRVRVLSGGWRAAGRHAVVWDGRDGRGRRVAAGTYMVRVRAGGASERRRVVVLP